MSAFICSNEHISILASYAILHDACTNAGSVSRIVGNAENVGIILLNENIRSVNYRYKENMSFVDKFTLDIWALHILPAITPIQILKACNCLEYQSCETPDYKSSIAYGIIQGIKDVAIRRLPGYETAYWEMVKNKPNTPIANKLG